MAMQLMCTITIGALVGRPPTAATAALYSSVLDDSDMLHPTFPSARSKALLSAVSPQASYGGVSRLRACCRAWSCVCVATTSLQQAGRLDDMGSGL